jgi:hypothetical protein
MTAPATAQGKKYHRRAAEDAEHASYVRKAGIHARAPNSPWWCSTYAAMTGTAAAGGSGPSGKRHKRDNIRETLKVADIEGH